MSSVQYLYRLQQLDNEITQKKRRLAEVVQLQRETEELLAARRRLQEAVVEETRLSTQQSGLNLELGGMNDEARRSEQRLYSGQVTNPKELEDLQHKVEALGRRRGVLEDEILETMILLEDAQLEKAEAQEALLRIESAWQGTQSALKEEQDELALALHGLIGDRAQMAERIDADALAEYESLRARKNGVAVVGLTNNTCGGCHVSVSSNLALRAERGERVHCNGCGRIIFPL